MYETGRKYTDADNALPHLKLLVARNNNATDDDTFIYLGSHNFNKAAWGNRDHRRKETIPTILN